MSAVLFAHGFIALLLTGATLQLAVVITALASRNASKSVVWLNLSISVVIYALSYSLLFFFGHQTGAPPPFQLCLVQTALIYAVPWLITSCGLALAVQLFGDMTMLSAPERHIRIRTTLLIVIPYTAFLAVGAVALAYGARGSPIERTVNDAYCHFADGHFSVYSAIGLTLVQGNTVALTGFTMFKLFRYCRVAHGLRNPAARLIFRSLIRMSAFIVYGAIALALSVGVGFQDTVDRSLLDGPIGASPLALFLIFGLHQDLIGIWCFWRPNIDKRDAK